MSEEQTPELEQQESEAAKELPITTQDQVQSIRELLEGQSDSSDKPTDTPAEGQAEGEGEAITPREGANDGNKASDEGGGVQDTEPRVTSLDELVEATGLSAAEFYALNLPMGDDGSVMTVGELKDLVKDGKRRGEEEYSQELLEREQALENATIRAKQEFKELVSLLPPGSVSPELMQRARAALEQHLELQRLELADVKPEWRDPEVYARAEDQMVGMIERYGFSRADFSSIVDSRLKKLIYDFAALDARVAKADASHKEVRNSLRRIRTTTNKQGPKARETTQDMERAKAGDKAARDRAVSDLVRSAQ